MRRYAFAFALLTACTTNGNIDFHCPYVTGQKNELEFCPGDPNAVGDGRLNLTLGKADEITLDTTAQTGGVTYATATSSSDAVDAQAGSSNVLTLIPDGLGDSTVSVGDGFGNEIDRVAVHVDRCNGHLGEYGKAMFCGDSDGSGRLAVPVGSQAQIEVFTPSYGRLDFKAASASDYSHVGVYISQSCDPRFEYCTNVFTVTGQALGSVDVGVTDDSGEIDQLTIDVIDHW